jgi:polysaccharide chain length determinant protein (PEP-CTERM system associated)
MSMQIGRDTAVEMVMGVWARRRGIAVVVFAVAFAAAASVTRTLPDVYRSTATVLVERHQVPEVFVRSAVTGELETRLQTISQEILGRKRLEHLITRFGLYADLRQRASMEAALERMRRDIQLELKGVEQASGRGATVAFALSYRGRDPETVAQVTNTLASFYVDGNSEIRERQAVGTAEFLKARLTDAKTRLDEQEHRVREYRARHVGELPQQMTVNLATLERLHAQLHLASANQLRVMDRRMALLKELAETKSGDGPRGPQTPGARLAKLKDELGDLRRQFSDIHPDVIRMKKDIAELEREVAEAPAALPAPAPPPDATVQRMRTAIAEVDTELEASRAEERRLRSDIAAYQRRVENAPQREQEYQELARDYDMAKDLYMSLLRRYEDAQLSGSMEQHQKGEQFRILDAAIPARQPAAPNRSRLMLVGLLFSLALAAAAVVVAERLDTSFHTVNDLRALTPAPVLVSIPLIVDDADARRQRTRAWVLTMAVALLLAIIVKVSAYVANENEFLVGLMVRGGS